MALSVVIENIDDLGEADAWLLHAYHNRRPSEANFTLSEYAQMYANDGESTKGQFCCGGPMTAEQDRRKPVQATAENKVSIPDMRVTADITRSGSGAAAAASSSSCGSRLHDRGDDPPLPKLASIIPEPSQSVGCDREGSKSAEALPSLAVVDPPPQTQTVGSDRDGGSAAETRPKLVPITSTPPQPVGEGRDGSRDVDAMPKLVPMTSTQTHSIGEERDGVKRTAVLPRLIPLDPQSVGEHRDGDKDVDALPELIPMITPQSQSVGSDRAGGKSAGALPKLVPIAQPHRRAEEQKRASGDKPKLVPLGTCCGACSDDVTHLVPVGTRMEQLASSCCGACSDDVTHLVPVGTRMEQLASSCCGSELSDEDASSAGHLVPVGTRMEQLCCGSERDGDVGGLISWTKRKLGRDKKKEKKKKDKEKEEREREKEKEEVVGNPVDYRQTMPHLVPIGKPVGTSGQPRSSSSSSAKGKHVGNPADDGQTMPHLVPIGTPGGPVATAACVAPPCSMNVPSRDFSFFIKLLQKYAAGNPAAFERPCIAVAVSDAGLDTDVRMTLLKRSDPTTFVADNLGILADKKMLDPRVLYDTLGSGVHLVKTGSVSPRRRYYVKVDDNVMSISKTSDMKDKQRCSLFKLAQFPNLLVLGIRDPVFTKPM